MMSGEDNQNDNKKDDKSDNQSQSENSGSENKTSDGGLFSGDSEAKSYPFSVPQDKVSSETASDNPDLTESTGSSAEQKAEDQSPAIENTLEDVSEKSVPENSSDQQGEELDEDIEASLDEGLFSNEVLPEEGGASDKEEAAETPEGEVPIAASDEPAHLQEPVVTSDMESDTPPDMPENPVPPLEAQESHQSTNEGPNHAFDMGQSQMSEKDFTESVKEKSRFGTIVASIVIFLLLIGVLIGGGFFYVKLRFDSPGSQNQSLTHVIKPKQGMRIIAEDLEKKGIVEDKNIFMLGALINQANKSLKAGEFEFAPNASMREVLETITKGKVLQHKITFAEGLTTQQIIEIINKNPVLTGEITNTPEEGTLLPETYQFERGMTRQQIIDRMKKAQTDLIEKIWPGRDDDLGVVTPGDALILASIIEKETGLSSERTRVSAVFNNRLRKKMRLQSDPTVIYGVVGGAGKLGRPITRSDLDNKTPYNTYQIDGLPPTPIANPGKASIEAALKPAKTNDLYFVADGTGGHAFATTLKEHNENVARWRKLENGVTPPPVPVETKSLTAEKVEKAVEKTEKSVKGGKLKKTTTLNSDKETSAQKPKKSDLGIPAEKPKTVEKVKDNKSSLTEKVRNIFVKPEEAPLPRAKPGLSVKQGTDKINITPLPEQKVPPVNVNTPIVPKVTTPEATAPSVEPTPELEAVKPKPPEKPFNPFGD